MCNLYKMDSTVSELKKAFGSFSGDRDNLPAFAAIYPDTEAPIIRNGQNGLSLSVIPWGIPSWQEKARPITNVRNLKSNFWKGMLSQPEDKCLVPVTSFCEWTGEKGKKEKVWFRMKDQSPFAFAGIWRETKDGERFTFLTTEPNSLVAPIHPKAMPVILNSDSYQKWLDSNYDDAVRMAVPFPSSEMEIVSV